MKSSKMGVALPIIRKKWLGIVNAGNGNRYENSTDNRRCQRVHLDRIVVVVCVLAVVAVLILPILARPHYHYGLNCVNNLKQIGLAFRIWEGDNGGKYPMQVSVTSGGAMELAVTGNVVGIFRVMSNELSTTKVLVCPQDTKRTAATDFAGGLSDANISYFVGLDAEDKYPQMILSGDDNLDVVNGVRVRPGILNLSTNASVEWTENERHGRPQQWSFRNQHLHIGNIGLVDGSVQTTTTSAIQSALANTGFVTNRLVIP